MLSSIQIYPEGLPNHGESDHSDWCTFIRKNKIEWVSVKTIQALLVAATSELRYNAPRIARYALRCEKA
jgi:hypothetical protein